MRHCRLGLRISKHSNDVLLPHGVSHLQEGPLQQLGLHSRCHCHSGYFSSFSCFAFLFIHISRLLLALCFFYLLLKYINAYVFFVCHKFPFFDLLMPIRPRSVFCFAFSTEYYHTFYFISLINEIKFRENLLDCCASEAIENCWKNGFDPEGAKQFGGKLRDTKGMIGATDAAALFRSFGIKYFTLPFYLLRRFFPFHTNLHFPIEQTLSFHRLFL